MFATCSCVIMREKGLGVVFAPSKGFLVLKGFGEVGVLVVDLQMGGGLK